MPYTHVKDGRAGMWGRYPQRLYDGWELLKLGLSSTKSDNKWSLSFPSIILREIIPDTNIKEVILSFHNNLFKQSNRYSSKTSSLLFKLPKVSVEKEAVILYNSAIRFSSCHVKETIINNNRGGTNLQKKKER